MRGRRYALINGSWPAPHSVEDAQHNNPTSRQLGQSWGHYNFQWNDLFLWVPPSTTASFNSEGMLPAIMEAGEAVTELARQQLQRADSWCRERVVNGDPFPLSVYVGREANAGFELALKGERSGRATMTLQFHGPNRITVWRRDVAASAEGPAFSCQVVTGVSPFAPFLPNKHTSSIIMRAFAVSILTTNIGTKMVCAFFFF